jgi:hypothetical protein
MMAGTEINGRPPMATETSAGRLNNISKSFSLNTDSNKYSFLFSNTVICTAIHGEGEKVNFRQNVTDFFPL